MLIAACATSAPPVAPPAPPRRELPASVRAPCPLTVLGPNPGPAEIEAGYHARGAEVIGCDVQRQIAVDTHDGEHADQDAWRAAGPR